MKEKLVKIGDKAFEFIMDVFDNDTIKYVAGAAIAAGCVSYVYNRGFKDACNNVGALLEIDRQIESK